MRRVSRHSGDDRAPGEALAFIQANNMILFKEMNVVVVMMQQQSEARIKQLILFQAVAIILGFFLMTFNVLTIRKIVHQLDNTSEISHAQKTVILTKDSTSGTNPEPSRATSAYSPEI